MTFVHNGASRDRSLMSASNTLIELAVTQKVVLMMSTFRTAKAFLPAELKEMLATGFFIGKSVLKLQ